MSNNGSEERMSFLVYHMKEILLIDTIDFYN